MVRIGRLALLLLAAILVAGCTANGGAIFAIIEQEERTLDSDLPPAASVTNVMELDGSFLAAATVLYRGTPTAATNDDPDILSWAPVSSYLSDVEAGDGLQPASVGCRGAVLAPDGLLYAVFASDASGGALYRADPSGLSTANTLEWARQDVITGATADGILLVGGEVFVITAVDGILPTYGLVHLITTDPPTATDVLGSAALASPVRDGAFDGTAYWFASGSRLLTGALPGPLTVSADPAIPAGAVLGGVHVDRATNRVWVSTSGGQVIYREGTTWTASAELVVPTKDDRISFTDFLDLDGTVYVGTERRGIYRLSGTGLDQAADVDGDVARYPNQTINELFTGTVLRMVPVTGMVFVLTAGNGMWHAPVSGEGLPLTGWRWE